MSKWLCDLHGVTSISYSVYLCCIEGQLQLMETLKVVKDIHIPAMFVSSGWTEQVLMGDVVAAKWRSFPAPVAHKHQATEENENEKLPSLCFTFTCQFYLMTVTSSESPPVCRLNWSNASVFIGDLKPRDTDWSVSRLRKCKYRYIDRLCDQLIKPGIYPTTVFSIIQMQLI